MNQESIEKITILRSGLIEKYEKLRDYKTNQNALMKDGRDTLKSVCKSFGSSRSHETSNNTIKQCATYIHRSMVGHATMITMRR